MYTWILLKNGLYIGICSISSASFNAFWCMFFSFISSMRINLEIGIWKKRSVPSKKICFSLHYYYYDNAVDNYIYRTNNKLHKWLFLFMKTFMLFRNKWDRIEVDHVTMATCFFTCSYWTIMKSVPRCLSKWQ